MFCASLLITLAIGLASCKTVAKEDGTENKQALYPNGVFPQYCQQYGWPAGTYPDPYDCRKFVNCNGGQTTEQACPAGTVFNPNIKVCDSPANVPICNYNAPVGQSPFYVNNLCQQYGYGNGMYFHPYDCGQYINCNFGNTQINACPAGTVYDANQRACIGFNGINNHVNGVNGYNGYCNQYVFNPQGVYPQNGVAVQPDYTNYCQTARLTNGIHPDPYSCLSYLQCTFGVTAHMPCPAGLSFDRNLLVCDDNRYNNCNYNGIGYPNGVVGK